MVGFLKGNGIRERWMVRWNIQIIMGEFNIKCMLWGKKIIVFWFEK